MAVFSDTHGNDREMRDAIMSQGPFDLMIHLGDGVLNGERVSKELNLPLVGVSGNEDMASGFPEKRVLNIRSWNFLLLHGYQTEINPYQPREIWDGHIRELCGMAEEEGVHILLFGHTHRPMLEKTQGIILCNPGDHHPGSTQSPTFVVIRLNPDTLEMKIMEKKDRGDWIMLQSRLFKSPSQTPCRGMF